MAGRALDALSIPVCLSKPSSSPSLPSFQSSSPSSAAPQSLYCLLKLPGFFFYFSPSELLYCRRRHVGSGGG
ncbi:hypothetical protein DsansV1_C10g0103301 [Dioscorea sansibarensis]